jgi:hypothetical protein
VQLSSLREMETRDYLLSGFHLSSFTFPLLLEPDAVKSRQLFLPIERCVANLIPVRFGGKHQSGAFAHTYRPSPIDYRLKDFRIGASWLCRV